MPSTRPKSAELPDFERDLHLTEADQIALDRAREVPAMSFGDYLVWLSEMTRGVPASREVTPIDAEPFEL
jgi:hypothetical protein